MIQSNFLQSFSLALSLSFFAIGCAGTSREQAESEIFGYVGSGAGAPVVTIHSPQRKPTKKVRNLPIGAPLKDCVPNLPEELSVDPEETFNRFTHQDDGYDKIREFYLKEATPLQKPLYLNRWGEKEFEVNLVENSLKSLPVFDIFTINHGFSYEGRGLYTDLTPIGSFGYGVKPYFDHIGDGDWNLEIPMLITIRIPAGTYYLDLSRRQSLADGKNSNKYSNFIQNDQAQTYYPAPLVINYMSSPGSIPIVRNPNAPTSGRIKTKMGMHWHVIKSAEGVEAKEFDGQEYSTEDLIEFKKIMKVATDSNVPHADKVVNYYNARVSPILSKRIFRPGGQEQVPYPLTALYPAKIWGHFNEMKHCVGAQIPNPSRDPIYYYWRWDGTCGGYAEPEGKLLVVENRSRKDEPNYNAKADPANQPCLIKYPTQPLWIRDEHLNGLRCMDGVPIEHESLSPEERKSSIHSILIGRHSPSEDCGPQ